MTTQQSIATLGGGCFWCLEAVYQQLDGVERVVSGYAGGHVENPTYEQVCGKKTGHVEVVQVTFDPARVSYRDVLEVFFSIHDPTTKDRQGNDVGPQYRSAIFYHDDEQREVAESIIAELAAEHAFDAPIVTELKPFERFYSAEQYHQNYYAQNSSQPYCAYVISPKIAKFRRKFAERLRA
ncbi:MAG TPA: peptide-methionine (S)-S-oxide reductase MsrA [Gemmatimonadaceae bacterium]|jgi:peptide-methionine (S)-S-oxide reductase|nr:peptide-methionine (S)-S-oxide reductase MsrA [Gemmatimonadaceae bacterium]